MRTVVKDVNREDPLGLHLEEFRAGMKSLEKKVKQLEAKITTLEAEGMR